MTELNEARDAVAIIRRQSGDVNAHDPGRCTFGFSLALTALLSGDHVSLVPSNG
jgi:hypothetical protein